MIKKILKDVLGENFTENNEKYAKINFIIVIGNMACSCYFFGTEFYFYQAKKVIIIK